jgi:hypothetical protein
MVSGAIHEEHVTILSVDSWRFERTTAKVIKLKGQTDKSVTIFEDFNIPPSVILPLSKKNISQNL